MKNWAYLAFENYENELAEEIKFRKIKKVTQMGRLFLLEQEVKLNWAQLTLGNLETHNFKSVNEAAKILRSRNFFWGAYSYQFHRRTELIQKTIDNRKSKAIDHLSPLPKKDFGFWCLLSENSLLLSKNSGQPFALGQFEFNENHDEPPSRAYLKLWETLTCHVQPPKKNSLVLDLGSCPGGWTWVLKNLSCRVISVDKAPLDPRIQNDPLVQYMKKDAFKLNPLDIQNPEWLFSDIICEPEVLLELVKKWITAHPNLKFVCTIKYKGSTDFKVTDQFLEIKGSRVVHLNYNKHELTWIKS